MPLNYDPDEKPKISREALREARQIGLHPVEVICDEPDAKVGDHIGVSFMACVAFVPRAGERIVLEDGTVCRVKDVRYKAVTVPEVDCVSMWPTIYAVRISNERQSDSD